MMTCDEIQARLSDFVDGAVDPADRSAIEAHLRSCDMCAGLARDFDRLRQTARSLGPMDPPPHVWLEVAGQIRQGTDQAPGAAPPGPRIAPMWQWVSLAAALVIVTTGAYIFVRLGRQVPVVPPASDQAGTGSVEVFADELTQAMTHYQKAIAELEAITKNNNGALDPKLAATLQQNLVVIDGAITESRTALERDPASLPARESLLEALQRKVSVLQETVALMNEIRQGNQAGVAAIAAKVPKNPS